MSETEFVLFQNIIGGIETFLYAVCLTAFFYPFMTEKKERQGSKLKKILIVFGSLYSHIPYWKLCSCLWVVRFDDCNNFIDGIFWLFRHE